MKKLNDILKKEGMQIGSKCEFCNVIYTSSEQATQHLNGARHKRALEEAQNPHAGADQSNATSEKPESVLPAPQKPMQKPMQKPYQQESYQQESYQQESYQQESFQPRSSGSRFSCEICDIKVSTAESLARHFTGKQHKAKMQEIHKLAYGDRCEICHVEYPNAEMAKQHLQGARHKQRLMDVNQVLGNEFKEKEQLKNEANALAAAATQIPSHDKRKATHFACDTCHITTSSRELLAAHFAGKKHQLKLKFLAGSSPESELKVLKPFSCELCSIRTKGLEDLNYHLAGKKHQNKLEQSLESGAITLDSYMKYEKAMHSMKGVESQDGSSSSKTVDPTVDPLNPRLLSSSSSSSKVPVPWDTSNPPLPTGPLPLEAPLPAEPSPPPLAAVAVAVAEHMSSVAPIFSSEGNKQMEMSNPTACVEPSSTLEGSPQTEMPQPDQSWMQIQPAQHTGLNT